MWSSEPVHKCIPKMALQRTAPVCPEKRLRQEPSVPHLQPAGTQDEQKAANEQKAGTQDERLGAS